MLVMRWNFHFTCTMQDAFRGEPKHIFSWAMFLQENVITENGNENPSPCSCFTILSYYTEMLLFFQPLFETNK
jgi:hypothetical protein